MKLLLLILLVAFCQPLIAESTPYDIVATTDYCGVLPTGSMEPTINEHHWLLYKKLVFKDLRVGDIIIYTLPKPVEVGPYTAVTACHRIIRKSSGGSVLLVKGDANPDMDPWLVTEDMYVGTVVGIVRKD